MEMTSRMQQAVIQVLRRTLETLDSIGGDLKAVQAEIEDAGTAQSKEMGAIEDSLAAAEGAIFRSTRALRKELWRYAQGLEWDRVVVAFHGETNAGKSALIEAITRGDGAWVGDGRKDHTERLQERRWHGVTLRDTPGIEGKEGALLQEVERALATAHIVFIVLPDKEPEEETLHKIHQHTRRASHVFSVLNRRGRPTGYRDYTALVDAGTERQVARIRDKLAAAFGKNYRGHLTVHALLALLSHGAELRERFHRDREATLEIFGTLPIASEFSRVATIESALQSASREARSIILDSNLQRVMRVLDEARQHLTQAHQALSNGASLWKESVLEIQQMLEGLLRQAKRLIELRIDGDLQALAVALKQLIRDGIEQSHDWNIIRRDLNDAVKRASENLSGTLRKEFERLESEIRLCLSRLAARLHLHVELEPNLTDIGSLLAEMAKVGTRELLDVVLSAAGSALAYALNPVMGLVGFLLTGLRKFWEWRGGGRNRRLRESKAKANEAVDQSLDRLRGQQMKELEKSWRNFAQEVGNELNRVADIGESLENAALAFQQKASRLQKERSQLEQLFKHAA